MADNFYVQVSPSHRYGPFTKREANALIRKLKGKAHQGFAQLGYFPLERYPFLVEWTQHGRSANEKLGV